MSRVDYWLRKLKTLHKKVPPVFLIGTHCDDPGCNDQVSKSVY
jgi:hypothetical protein